MLGAHRYEGRYDEQELTGAMATVAAERMKRGYGYIPPRARTYVYDVCVLCGDVIERENDHE
jgi:hypothetical protein